MYFCSQQQEDYHRTTEGLKVKRTSGGCLVHSLQLKQGHLELVAQDCIRMVS